GGNQPRLFSRWLIAAEVAESRKLPQFALRITLRSSDASDGFLISKSRVAPPAPHAPRHWSIGVVGCRCFPVSRGHLCLSGLAFRLCLRCACLRGSCFAFGRAGTADAAHDEGKQEE